MKKPGETEPHKSPRVWAFNLWYALLAVLVLILVAAMIWVAMA